MHNNPSHINYGFHYGEERPPAQAPGYPPPIYPTVPLYSNAAPAPINTHYTVTSGFPHTPAARKVSRNRCLCITAAVIFVFVILAIAAVLLWYFLAGACVTGRTCGQSSTCVRSSQWCDGRTDCPAGEDEAQCFRFYGPNSMLQSFSNEDQKWKVVCSDRWNDNTGKQACKEIGYSSSDYVSYGTIDPGSSAGDGYMTLKSDYSNVLSSEPVHSSLSNSARCQTNTVVTLKCIDCGRSLAPGTRIVGGEVVNTLGRWPWQVSLHATGSHTCGGSIITPSWIVTAAHCVQSLSSPSQWKVYAGYLTLNQMEYVSGNSVARIISHPGFDTDNNNNDIALMKLWTPLQISSSIRPVCLPNTGLDLSTSRTYYVTGWGATRSQGSASNELREAQVSLISRTVCNSQQVYNGRITDTMICAGKLEGGVDSCQGDSGGPLVTSENFLWWLVGDTSWGQGCAIRNRPGVYGNVTTFLEWIYTQMKKY
ncbi:transmembrane protease serine 2 [Ictalurus furcatus]|uniref:transmembrane protease serine 2 n=1 Tax=Ictalurus furcatus TaxID=66913 RepID=UPI0023500C8A|nr:transmembrane protease serine 2 [Ictalurus furcatus]XP_053501797.1 transmembrane protease serine 2 [Ictalurus furcatus]